MNLSEQLSDRLCNNCDDQQAFELNAQYFAGLSDNVTKIQLCLADAVNQEGLSPDDEQMIDDLCSERSVDSESPIILADGRVTSIREAMKQAIRTVNEDFQDTEFSNNILTVGSSINASLDDVATSLNANQQTLEMLTLGLNSLGYAAKDATARAADIFMDLYNSSTIAGAKTEELANVIYGVLSNPDSTSRMKMKALVDLLGYDDSAEAQDNGSGGVTIPSTISDVTGCTAFSIATGALLGGATKVANTLLNADSWTTAVTAVFNLWVEGWKISLKISSFIASVPFKVANWLFGQFRDKVINPNDIEVVDKTGGCGTVEGGYTSIAVPFSNLKAMDRLYDHDWTNLPNPGFMSVCSEVRSLMGNILTYSYATSLYSKMEDGMLYKICVGPTALYMRKVSDFNTAALYDTNERRGFMIYIENSLVSTNVYNAYTAGDDTIKGYLNSEFIRKYDPDIFESETETWNSIQNGAFIAGELLKPSLPSSNDTITSFLLQGWDWKYLFIDKANDPAASELTNALFAQQLTGLGSGTDISINTAPTGDGANIKSDVCGKAQYNIVDPYQYSDLTVYLASGTATPTWRNASQRKYARLLMTTSVVFDLFYMAINNSLRKTGRAIPYSKVFSLQPHSYRVKTDTDYDNIAKNLGKAAIAAVIIVGASLLFLKVRKSAMNFSFKLSSIATAKQTGLNQAILNGTATTEQFMDAQKAARKANLIAKLTGTGAKVATTDLGQLLNQLKEGQNTSQASQVTTDELVQQIRTILKG